VAAVGERLAFLIGNQTFDEATSGLKPLRGPHNDVAAMAEILGDSERGNFAVRTFLDAPHHAILREIEAAAMRLTSSDLLLIFYAGHGTWSTGQYCLATADTAASAVQATSIATRRLADILRPCEGTVVVLLDCCDSGEAAEHLTRGDLGSAVHWFTENAQGSFVLTSSTGAQTSHETEVDGVVHGRFTATLLEALRSDDAARQGDDRVRFMDLRAWVATHLKGQTPRHGVGRNAEGDPIIARVPRGGADHRRIERLGELLAGRGITAAEYAAMCAALLDAGNPPHAALLREVLEQPHATAVTVATAWRAATRRAPGPPPRPAPGPGAAADAQAPLHLAEERAGPAAAAPQPATAAPAAVAAQSPPRRARYKAGWQIVPVALIIGLPVGLLFANIQIPRPEDVPFLAGGAAAAVLAASVLARFPAQWSFHQAALRLGISLVALLAASSFAVRSTSDDAFAPIFLLLGLVAGVSAWRLVAMPLARGRGRAVPSTASDLLPAAAAAAAGTFILLLLAAGLFGPAEGHGVARYSSVPGGMAAAALGAAAVVCALCVTAALRASKDRAATLRPAREG
jgi:hypothetical protein